MSKKQEKMLSKEMYNVIISLLEMTLEQTKETTTKGLLNAVLSIMRDFEKRQALSGRLGGRPNKKEKDHGK